jgi:hypothetical protein
MASHLHCALIVSVWSVLGAAAVTVHLSQFFIISNHLFFAGILLLLFSSEKIDDHVKNSMIDSIIDRGV